MPRAPNGRSTLLLSIAMVAVGLVLASLLTDLMVLPGRSAGADLRVVRGAAARPAPGRAVLVLTMGLYFAEGSGVTWGNLAWFLFAAVAGVVSLWLWQFVLLPYDPRRSLRNSVQAFYRPRGFACRRRGRRT